MRSGEKGSVLIYILIGIVLFAALNYAFSQMNRGGGGNANNELYQLQATEILQHARGMKTAIQAMQINGVTDSLVSFENATVAGYVNAGCGSGSCKLFDPDGGGMGYAKANLDWLDKNQVAGAGYGHWVFSGSNEVIGVGSDGGGASSVELLAILPWLRKELCIKINALLGIDNPSGAPPSDSGNVNLATKFTGTYTASQAIGGGDPQIEGQRTGCFEGGGSPAAGTYHFYQVLLAR